jgi:hypothetical protein
MLKIQLQLSFILQFPDYDKSRHNFAIAQFSSKDSANFHPRSARTLPSPYLPSRPLSRAHSPSVSLSRPLFRKLRVRVSTNTSSMVQKKIRFWMKLLLHTTLAFWWWK